MEALSRVGLAGRVNHRPASSPADSNSVSRSRAPWSQSPT